MSSEVTGLQCRLLILLAIFKHTEIAIREKQAVAKKNVTVSQILGR